jgi:Flp pilus assembly protein CpaB
MTYRIRNLIVAVGLALVAMLLVLLYVTNYKRSVQHAVANDQVFVAAHDIAVGTPGTEIIAKHDLRATNVPHGAVVPGAISDVSQIKSLVLSSPIYAGEQITVRPFSDVAAQGIRAHLRGTMRALQLSGDTTQLLGGTLQAGDHVDLVANLRLDPNSSATASKLIVRDIPVLATGDTGSAARVAGSGQSSVILALTDVQVPKLYLAVKDGDWSLDLRPVVGSADSRDRIETLSSVLAVQGGK